MGMEISKWRDKLRNSFSIRSFAHRLRLGFSRVGDDATPEETSKNPNFYTILKYIKYNIVIVTDHRHWTKRVEGARLSGLHHYHRGETVGRSEHGSSRLRANWRPTKVHQRQGVNELPVLQRGAFFYLKRKIVFFFLDFETENTGTNSMFQSKSSFSHSMILF